MSLLILDSRRFIVMNLNVVYGTVILGFVYIGLNALYNVYRSLADNLKVKYRNLNKHKMLRNVASL